MTHSASHNELKCSFITRPDAIGLESSHYFPFSNYQGIWEVAVFPLPHARYSARGTVSCGVGGVARSETPLLLRLWRATPRPGRRAFNSENSCCRELAALGARVSIKTNHRTCLANWRAQNPLLQLTRLQSRVMDISAAGMLLRRRRVVIQVQSVGTLPSFFIQYEVQ